MRVYHFNTDIKGGAATAARRIHESLQAAGIDSQFLHGRGCEVQGQPSYGKFLPDFASRCLIERARGFLERRARRNVPVKLSALTAEGFEPFQVALLPRCTPFDVRSRGADIVHLHWVANLIDYPSFFRLLPRGFPIVWTLHDMLPFTGGCHYTWDCERFRSGCGQCPQLRSAGERDLSSQGFRIKRCALAGQNIHVVADSRWLEQEARRSVLLGQARSFRTIYYGLDTVAFSPRPKEECRRSLGVEPGRFVVCFGADFTASRRKGLRELLSALTTVATASPVLCLSFGNDSPPEVDPRVEIRSLGYLGSAEALSTAYSAADLFLIPSLHEAFGQVAMEAMACGTPVVGFDTGGIPEMVRPGVTGLVAHRGDVADLAAKIQWMIDNPAERERMGREARLTVLRDFPGERQGVLYRELYESLLHRSA